MLGFLPGMGLVDISARRRRRRSAPAVAEKVGDGRGQERWPVRRAIPVILLPALVHRLPLQRDGLFRVVLHVERALDHQGLPALDDVGVLGSLGGRESRVHVGSAEPLLLFGGQRAHDPGQPEALPRREDYD